MSCINEIFKLRQSRDALFALSRQAELDLAVATEKLHARTREFHRSWHFKPDFFRNSNTGQLYVALYLEDRAQLIESKQHCERALVEIDVKLARKEAVIRALEGRLRPRRPPGLRQARGGSKLRFEVAADQIEADEDEADEALRTEVRWGKIVQWWLLWCGA
jgi:hypothetical protein